MRRARRLLLVKNFSPLAAAILINYKDEMKNLKTHRCCSLQLAPQSITRTVHMKYWQPRCPICSMRVKDIWDWPRPLSPRSFTVVHRSHFVILQSLYRSEISATFIEHRTSTVGLVSINYSCTQDEVAQKAQSGKNLSLDRDNTGSILNRGKSFFFVTTLNKL